MSPFDGIVFACLFVGLEVFVLVPFGLLTLAICRFVSLLLFSLPLTSDFSAWYAGTSLVVLLAVLALAGYAFHTSLGGQKLFEGRLLNE